MMSSPNMVFAGCKAASERQALLLKWLLRCLPSDGGQDLDEHKQHLSSNVGLSSHQHMDMLAAMTDK